MVAQPVELYTECDHCRVEASCVEVYDVSAHACRFGVPRDVRCRLCARVRSGRLTIGQAAAAASLATVPSNACPCCGQPLPPESVDTASCPACGCKATLEVVHEGRVFASRTELEQALGAWAVEENFANVGELLIATFVDPDVDRLLAKLMQRERIETVADPFALGARSMAEAPPKSKRPWVAPAMAQPHPQPLPSGGAAQTPLPKGGVGGGNAPWQAPSQAPSQAQAPFPPPPPSQGPRSAPPRAIVYPLVSVIAADGELAPKEREIVDRFLVSEGMPPLTDDEFRVHEPSRVARYIPEHRREAVLRLMCETAAIDGMPDESEIRVIRAFATAWRIPDEKVDLWIWGYENIHASSARLFWLRIRRFLLSSRWEDT